MVGKRYAFLMVLYCYALNNYNREQIKDQYGIIISQYGISSDTMGIQLPPLRVPHLT